MAKLEEFYYGKYKVAVTHPDFPSNSQIPYEMKLYIDKQKGKYIWGRDVFRQSNILESRWKTNYFTGIVSKDKITLNGMTNLFTGTIHKKKKIVKLNFSDFQNNSSFYVRLRGLKTETGKS